MGRSNITTLGLPPSRPRSRIPLLYLRRLSELSIPTSIIHMLQCYAWHIILRVLELWKDHSSLQALNGIVLACIVSTVALVLWTAFGNTAPAPTDTTSNVSRCLSSISGGFMAGLGIRLAGGLGKSNQSTLNAASMIVTTIFTRSAVLQAQLVEPDMQSVGSMFLRPDFVAPLIIVGLVANTRPAAFGSATDIWMFQMLPEFGLALLLDWAHVKTAVGVGEIAQGNGHVRRRRRGGGGEANLLDFNGEVQLEWQYVY